MQQQVLIIGGSGFVGSHLSKELIKQNYEVIVSKRPDSGSKYILDPRVKTLSHHDFSEMGMRELLGMVDPSSVVINLIGVLHAQQEEPYGPEFLEAHVDIPTHIMSAMQFLGMKRYLHMSALGADPDGPSMYLRSKGDAEQLVKASDIDWTIFRPSVIFGKDDQFINMFGKLQKFAPFMPLAGANVLFQPVSVEDVSMAFTKAITLPQTIHKSYDLCGPKTYTLAQIVRFAGERAKAKRPVFPLPDWVAYIQASILERLPGPTIMSRDNLASMKVASILPVNQTNPLEEVFQIKPTFLESLLD
jgi:NADH dehydrogenase